MNRIKQESTWRGLILMLTAFGVQIAPELQEAIITVGLALVGVKGITSTYHDTNQTDFCRIQNFRKL
jgi:hypothetical protein